MSQADLFAAPVIAGLEYRPDLISSDEERNLIERIEGLNVTPFRFQGWVGNRKTKSFGWRYDFDDSSFSPTEPIPDWLEPIRKRAAALAGVASNEIVHCLVARYDPGAGIGWHRDRDVFDRVVGVSLGSPAVLRFRQRTANGFRRVNLPVDPRSAYVLSGDVRLCWEHRIVPGEQLRFSITFRTLSDKGQATAQRNS